MISSQLIKIDTLACEKSTLIGTSGSIDYHTTKSQYNAFVVNLALAASCAVV